MGHPAQLLSNEEISFEALMFSLLRGDIIDEYSFLTLINSNVILKNEIPLTTFLRIITFRDKISRTTLEEGIKCFQNVFSFASAYDPDLFLNYARATSMILKELEKRSSH